MINQLKLSNKSRTERQRTGSELLLMATYSMLVLDTACAYCVTVYMMCPSQENKTGISARRNYSNRPCLAGASNHLMTSNRSCWFHFKAVVSAAINGISKCTRFS